MGWFSSFFPRKLRKNTRKFRAVDPNDKIPGAENFTYGEFTRSAQAVRHGISNTPVDSEWRNIELLARNVLQPARDALGGLRITSGFRCESLNNIVGGSRKSFHRFGYAADIEPLREGVSLLDLLEWIYNNCDFVELIAEYFPQGWVHVAYIDGRNSKTVKLKDENHNYVKVNLNYIKSLYG